MAMNKIINKIKPVIIEMIPLFAICSIVYAMVTVSMLIHGYDIPSSRVFVMAVMIIIAGGLNGLLEEESKEE